MLMAHLLDEDLPNKSLDYIGEYYVGIRKNRSAEMQQYLDLFGWANVPAYAIQEYAAHDAYLTLLVFEFLKVRFDEEDLKEYWTYEQEFIRTLIAIEGPGIKLDSGFCHEQITTGEDVMNKMAAALGVNPASPKDLKTLLIDQMGLPVLKETPGGKPSFDKATMIKYEKLLAEQEDERASQILTYRGWQKAVSSSYRNYLGHVASNGRLRPNYKIHGTVTGRLSCEQPNLQQIPRRSTKPWDGGLKRAFIAEPGWELWDFDYSNLELRLGAAYAREESLINIVNSGRDVFSEMAMELGFSRQDTKTLVYTIQFGGGANRIREVFNVSPARAQEIRETFFDRYPGFRMVMSKAQRTAERNSKVKIWSGRYRHFKGADNTYKAFNSIIQGGAADIVKRQIVRVHKTLDPAEARILLTVHDSIVVEIRKDRVEELVPEITRLMSTVIPDFGVNFDVEGRPWGA
jgi:DNA polymerase-1